MQPSPSPTVSPDVYPEEVAEALRRIMAASGYRVDRMREMLSTFPTVGQLKQDIADGFHGNRKERRAAAARARRKP